MTRLTMTLSAVLLTISIAPAVQAYGTDPAPDTLQSLSPVSFVMQDTAQSEGTCAARITPDLAEILGLPDDWRTDDNAPFADVACNGKN